jgi:hypothetical protein
MAKKDLFELLQVRHRTGGQRPARKAAADPLAGVRTWFQGVFRRTPGPARARTAPAPRLLALSGLGLALMLLGTLVTGFLLGRGLAPDPDLRQLNAPEKPAAEKPAWVPTGTWQGAPDLSAEKEVETLSQTFFVTLHFGDRERSRASRLAYYLRQQGLASARIKLVPMEAPYVGQHRWVTLVYADEENAGTVRGALDKIDPPEFEPTFASRKQKGFDLQKLKLAD